MIVEHEVVAMLPAPGHVAVTLVQLEGRGAVVTDRVLGWAVLREHATERTAKPSRVVDRWTEPALGALILVAGRLVVAHAEEGRGIRVRYAADGATADQLRRLVGAPDDAPILPGDDVPAEWDLAAAPGVAT